MTFILHAKVHYYYYIIPYLTVFLVYFIINAKKNRKKFGELKKT